MRVNLVTVWLVVLCLGVVLASPHARSADADPAARGLDAFIHAPRVAAPGGVVPIQLQAIGFPSVTTTRPLAGATIEAAWDPATLGPGRSSAPPALKSTTDANGRVHFDVPVPLGPPRSIQLLVSVRSGAHQRTQSISFDRAHSHEVMLHVADTSVVPGSTVSAWVLVRNTAAHTPAASTPIDLALLEGGNVRHTVRLRTDAAGTAAGRVRIPYIDAPTWTWTLRARVSASNNDDAGFASVELHPREETPGLPRMRAAWTAPTVEPGGKASFNVRLRDAADRPLANHEVRTWVGATGTQPPEDKKQWERVSKRAMTNMAGEIRGDAVAPSPVAPVVGTDLRVVVRAKVEGQELAETVSIHVGASAPSAELLPEAGAILAGREQHALVRVLDGWQRPVKGQFSIEGDGLSARVVTNEAGEADFVWTPPRDVGAYRDVGPCASGVAASILVRPLEDIPALDHRRDPFSLCVPIRRDVAGFVRVDTQVPNAGDTIRVRVDGGGGLPWSVVLTGNGGLVAASTWLDDGDKGGTLHIPDGAVGLMNLSATSPSLGDKGRAVHTAVLVRPRVLPMVEAKVAGGRPAPGGKVFVDAVLSDGHGHGLQGTVGALVFDLHGGGSAAGLWSLDTRRELCRLAGIDVERCEPFLEGEASMQSVRRGLLGAAAQQLNDLEPSRDPGAHVQSDLRAAFATVIRSLEGAILEASASPDRLRDVRRKDPRGQWTFNPELWTLVTAAMDSEPQTPGGEPFTLTDLAAIDRQVEFNNVARRVTRLKLMRVLVRVRQFVREHYADPDEPALADPAALLRRLVQDELLTHADLLDPWGGTMQFVRSPGPHLPFMTTRGFRLQAPGPDGRIGTPDDVRDPFDRVLRSKTPYAEAVGEDRLVDARLDMQVSDETVAKWESLLETLTGTSLGLSGIGEGGGGRGEGIGLGTIGTIGHGAGRSGFGITTENVVWLPPARTDANGRVRLEVPLGDVETTWRVALIGVPDATLTAVAAVDIPVALDVSARVEAGASWVAGDRVESRVSLRNRTKTAVRATLALTAGGVVTMVNTADQRMSVSIPAMGAATVKVPLVAKSAGGATLEVRTSVPGLREDVLKHRWEVKPAGEPTRMTQTAWIEDRKVIDLPIAAQRERPLGPATLVLERGLGPALAAALDALDPDVLVTPDAQADALEVALRIHRWAVGSGGENDPLALRAHSVARRALARLLVYARESASLPAISNVRARLAPLGGRLNFSNLPEAPSCPPEGAPTLTTALDYLEAEPAPVGGVVEACWDSFATDTTRMVTLTGDPETLARAVLALADRPHRSVLVASLGARLRESVNLTQAGWIQLPGASAEDRSSRSLVYAALIRSAKRRDKTAVSIERLAAWLAVQRAPHGGYGSSEATRAAVRAMLSLAQPSSAPARVTVSFGGQQRDLKLGASGAVSLQLGPRDTRVEVTTTAPGVLARLERKTLRLWSAPPLQAASPVQLDVEWPSNPRVGQTARLQVSLRHELGRDTTIDARIPLPPGVSLAAPLEGVRQVQGVLVIRRAMDGSALPGVMQIPVRFALAGTLTAPESYARLSFEQAERSVAPARPVTVK